MLNKMATDNFKRGDNYSSKKKWIVVTNSNTFAIILTMYDSLLDINEHIEGMNKRYDKPHVYKVLNKIYVNDGVEFLKYIKMLIHDFRLDGDFKRFGNHISATDTQFAFETKKQQYHKMMGIINFHFDNMKKQCCQPNPYIILFMESSIEDCETGTITKTELNQKIASYARMGSFEYGSKPEQKEFYEYMDMMFGPGKEWSGVKIKYEQEEVEIFNLFIEDRIIRCESSTIKKSELNNVFSLWYAASNYGGRGPSPKYLHDYMDKTFGARKDNRWSNVNIKFDNISLENQEDIGESADELTLEDVDELR